MSLALFTDNKTVKNHLRAGNLEVSLIRTNLEYTVLNSSGKLVLHKVEEDLNFTSSTSANVFGVDSSSLRIVPGSYFKADMQLRNSGNVAFTYDVVIQLTGQSNALAQQLEVTVTRADGASVTKKLSETKNGSFVVDTGSMLAGVTSQSFSVTVKFINDTGINDAAQAQLAEFDLIVRAIQATS